MNDSNARPAQLRPFTYRGDNFFADRDGTARFRPYEARKSKPQTTRAFNRSYCDYRAKGLSRSAARQGYPARGGQYQGAREAITGKAETTTASQEDLSPKRAFCGVAAGALSGFPPNPKMTDPCAYWFHRTASRESETITCPRFPQ
jgi:hypothetical protein